MIEYQIRYRLEGGLPSEFGMFKTDREALDWWADFTKDPKHKPREWALERRDGGGWATVAAHDASGASQ